MKRRFKSVMAIVLSVAVMFTFIPLMGGTAMAASKTVKVTAANKTIDFNSKVKVTAKTDKKVTWQSSDASIATVSSKGIVSAKDTVGEVTITAKAGKAKGSVVIEVVDGKKATKDSFRQLSQMEADSAGTVKNYGFGEIDYIADYKASRILGAEVQKEITDKYINEYTGGQAVLIRELGLDVEEIVVAQLTDPGDGHGCSGFAAANKKGETILGRNYDVDSQYGVAIHTHKNGVDVKYDAVGCVDLGSYTTNLDPELIKTDRGQTLMLLAPYYTVDGVNEKGLSMGVYQLDENMTLGNKDKQGKARMLESYFIRYCLDNCKNVNEVIKKVNEFSFVTPHTYYGYDYHWNVADRSGNMAIIEFINGKVTVTKGTTKSAKKSDAILDMTNNEFNAAGMMDFWYVYGEDTTIAKDRGAVSETAKITRAKKNFQVISNCYINKYKGKETINSMAGEGVNRYKEEYAVLDKYNGKVTEKTAMKALKAGKFYHSCGDIKACIEYAQKPEFAEKIAAAYEIPVENAKAYIEANLLTEEANWSWRTIWSAVYNTETSSLKLCHNENYDKTFSIELEY